MFALSIETPHIYSSDMFIFSVNEAQYYLCMHGVNLVAAVTVSLDHPQVSHYYISE